MSELKVITTPIRAEHHQSGIHTFLKCPRKYMYQYVLKIKTPSSPYHTVGRAVDKSVSLNFTQKIESGVDLPESDVIDACATDFDKEACETDFTGEDAGEQKDIAISCLKAHHRSIAPKVHPVTVQESFVLETDAGFNIGGTIDLTDQNGVVRDTKTSKRKYPADKITGGLQPALYDLAFESIRGKPATGFAYDVLVKPTKTMPAWTQVIEAKVTPADRTWAFQTLISVDKAIRAGVDTPAPEGSWYCSQRWCQFWSICKGRK